MSCHQNAFLGMAVITRIIELWKMEILAGRLLQTLFAHLGGVYRKGCLLLCLAFGSRGGCLSSMIVGHGTRAARANPV